LLSTQYLQYLFANFAVLKKSVPGTSEKESRADNSCGVVHLGGSMSINGIGSYQISANALYAGQNANTVQSGGDVDRSRITPPTTSSSNSLFTDTITQTLAQIGVTPTAASIATGAAPTNSPQQALSSFVQNLFGALQDSGEPATGGGTGTTTAAGAKSSSVARRDARGNIAALQGSGIDSQIQELAQQVSAGDTSGNADLSALQQSFQDLVAAQGGGTGASLGNFLQALAQNVQDVPPAGSLISTSA
jgi:hypothetical protein